MRTYEVVHQPEANCWTVESTDHRGRVEVVGGIFGSYRFPREAAAQRYASVLRVRGEPLQPSFGDARTPMTYARTVAEPVRVRPHCAFWALPVTESMWRE